MQLSQLNYNKNILRNSLKILKNLKTEFAWVKKSKFPVCGATLLHSPLKFMFLNVQPTKEFFSKFGLLKEKIFTSILDNKPIDSSI